jgi:hypothetical protein
MEEAIVSGGGEVWARMRIGIGWVMREGRREK